MATTTTTVLPFSKLKPGMWVEIDTVFGAKEGRLLSKHNASKTLKVLFSDSKYPTEGIEYTRLVGVPEPDPLDQIHPMLASTLKDGMLEEVLRDPDYVMERKYDGERQILTYFPVTETWFSVEHWLRFRATTRVVGKNTGVLAENQGKLPHLRHLPVPYTGETVFDAELLHPKGADEDERFRMLRSIMGSLDERALELQKEHGRVQAYLFDVLWMGGIDLRGIPFKERRGWLEQWYRNNVEGTHYESVAKLSPVARTYAEKQELLDAVQAEGGEGVMAKNVNGLYTDTTLPGQRSRDVLKVKPFQEDDVIITGFEMGKGMYNQDRYGAIRFAQWVHEHDMTEEMRKNVVPMHDPEYDGIPALLPAEMDSPEWYLVSMGTCSGITDEMEAKFRADPYRYIGSTMQVKFQARWKNSALMRHPNFVRLRPDKPASECIYLP